jgi:glutathione S-transferase
MSLRFPLTAAVMGLGWSVYRYLYMTGYTKGDASGKDRYQDIYFYFFQGFLISLAAVHGFMTILTM